MGVMVTRHAAGHIAFGVAADLSGKQPSTRSNSSTNSYMESVPPMAASDAERAFQKLVKTLTSNDASIEAPKPTRREFGSNALKVNGKIFAMLARGSLALAREARLFVGH
jgi:hypothetical protein